MNQKILFCIDSLKTIGGAEQMFIDQANYFASIGIEVHFAVSHSQKRDDWSTALHIGRPVQYFFFDSVFDWESHKALRAYIREHDIPVLYSYLDYTNMISRVAKLFLPKVRLVVVEPGDPRRKTAKMRVLDQLTGFWVYKIFAMGEAVKDHLLAYQPMHGKKIIAMRNGVHAMASASQVDARRAQAKPNRLHLLHVGNMNTENKGHRGILVAVQLVCEQKPDIDIQLVCIGEGRLKYEFMAWTKEYRLNDRITFTGFVPHNEISAYYRSADAFVFNSKTEGGAASIMEATSVGLPTITSDFDSVAEVVTDATGVIVEHNNAQQLADAMIVLAQDPEKRKTLGIAARALYENQFDYNMRAQEFINTIFS